MNVTINLTALHAAAARFNGISVRERALISVATLAVLLMAWNTLLMQPLTAKEKLLQSELDEVSTSMSTTASAMEAAMEPTNIALAQLQSTKAELSDVDGQLAATAAGMIEPQRMAEVIQDVLRQKHALTLISLRNQPVTSLVSNSSLDGDVTAAELTQAASNGPYIHPLELVVEGSYLDIVEYLHALETLPWHLYWNRLELQTASYPMNRVQIEISTLSLDAAWLDL